MKPIKNILKFASTIAITGTLATSAVADVNVAYFLEWATPNQIAKVEKAYDEAIGETINWVNFGSGGAMTEAMLAGDIDISFSQGLAPFVNAINANAPIKMVGIAVAYGAADDCIVNTKEGIDASNATELEGKAVAVPLNTMADYLSKLTIVDQEPADAAVSLVDGAVAMACGFGENSLSKMKEVGKPMLTTAEKTEAGISSFDIVSVTEKFAQENPEALRRFLEVTEEANAEFAKDQSKIDVIANDAGLTVEKTKAQMAGFTFPTVDEQLSAYFGKDGRVWDMLPFMGQMFATEQSPAKADYSPAVDTSFLK